MRFDSWLEDGNVPIDAPSFLCPFDRQLAVPVHALRILEDQGSFAMIFSRLVGLALAFGGANLAQCLKVVDSSTFNGNRFVIQHVVTFGGPASNWDRSFVHRPTATALGGR